MHSEKPSNGSCLPLQFGAGLFLAGVGAGGLVGAKLTRLRLADDPRRKAAPVNVRANTSETERKTNEEYREQNKRLVSKLSWFLEHDRLHRQYTSKHVYTSSEQEALLKSYIESETALRKALKRLDERSVYQAQTFNPENGARGEEA
jgi:hypothetical protein